MDVKEVKRKCSEILESIDAIKENIAHRERVKKNKEKLKLFEALKNREGYKVRFERFKDRTEVTLSEYNRKKKTWSDIKYVVLYYRNYNEWKWHI